jgi:hypothetical protein
LYWTLRESFKDSTKHNFSLPNILSMIKAGKEILLEILFKSS